MAEEKDKTAIVAGVVGGGLGVLATLLATRPASAADAEAQWEYLIKCQETMIGLLEKILAESKAPSVMVEVKTPWVAKDPEHIFNQAIAAADTFNSDKRIDFREGKRLLFKVESSLDQAVNIQLTGSMTDSLLLPTNIGPPLPCAANGNISIGLAWDDWHPFVAVVITAGVAPTTGMLNIWAIIQE